MQGPLELRTWHQWPSAIAESFRVTLTSILLSDNNTSRPRIIVLSSAKPGEGKTTVTSNLGIALARTNRRVLLIDGDMRKPRLHEVFGVDNRSGLSEVLAGDSSVSAHETRIPNLYVLPSGKRADERLFFTSRFRPLLRRLKTEFDMILIDTPPLLQMPDARLIGHQADAVILVVAQHTDRNAVLLAQQRLTEDGTYLLGTILNNWDPKTSSNGRHYGDHYKSYYSNDEIQ
jgi:capsular exopolysaccharide synthesis family protein